MLVCVLVRVCMQAVFANIHRLLLEEGVVDARQVGAAAWCGRCLTPSSMPQCTSQPLPLVAPGARLHRSHDACKC